MSFDGRHGSWSVAGARSQLIGVMYQGYECSEIYDYIFCVHTLSHPCCKLWSAT